MQLPVLERLKKDLADMQHELTHKVPKDLEEAAAHGDLRENAEYEAAKHRQEFLKARIVHVQERIRDLSLYNLDSIPHGVIAYGSKVTLEDLDEGNEVVYEIVFPEEVDPAKGLISLSSPIGRALMHKEEGDEVEVRAPAGKRTYEIKELLTIHDRR